MMFEGRTGRYMTNGCTVTHFGAAATGLALTGASKGDSSFPLNVLFKDSRKRKGGKGREVNYQGVLI